MTTRAVWWWQRRRPYPVRQRVWDLRPQTWQREARTTFVVLTTEQTLTNAMWTACSFGVQLGSRAEFSIVLDGTWSEPTRRQVCRLLPTAELREARDEMAALAEELPRLAALADAHPMGRKLAAILAAQQRSDVIFSDDDVLAFGDLDELTEHWINAAGPNRYLREEGGIARVEPSVQAAAAKLGLRMLPDINVGLLAIRRGSLDSRLVEEVLAGAGAPSTWFPDTALLSVLMAAADARPLPLSYLVSTAGQFWFEPRPDLDALQVRHYVGPVRHLMFAEGMPKVLRRLVSNAKSTVIP